MLEAYKDNFNLLCLIEKVTDLSLDLPCVQINFKNLRSSMFKTNYCCQLSIE